MKDSTSGRSRKIKILAMSPWGVTGGYGGPIVLQDRLLSALAKDHTCEITVIYRNRQMGALPDWASRHVSMVKSSPKVFTRAQKALWLFRTAQYVSRNGSKYDAVFLQGLYMINCIPALLLPKTISVIAMPVVEGGDLQPGNSSLKAISKSFFQSSLLKRRTLALSLSRSIQKSFCELGVPSSSTYVMNNLVDLETFVPATHDSYLSDRQIRLLFVGVLGKRKQPDIVVRACAKLLRLGYAVSCTFVGPFESVEYESYMRELVNVNDVADMINFVGYTSSTVEYYNNATAFILPSQSEGMPGAMSEAMSAGLPVLVSSAGAMPEVVAASGGGLVVDSFEIDSWVRAILLVHTDIAHRQKFSLAARAYAEAHMAPSRVAEAVARFVEHRSD